MSNANWWAKRLQNDQRPAHPSRQQLPPTAQPNYTPPPQPRPNPAVPTGPKPEKMTEALALGYTPKEAAKAGEVYQCPNCNSNNFFSLQGQRQFGPNGPVAPAPRCVECGYNGLYTQGVGG